MTRRPTAAISVICSLALVVPVLAGCSSSSSAAGPATGSITCKSISGSADFNPPLTLAGSAPDTTTIDLTATGCTTSGSNVSTVTSGTATTTNTTGTASCVALLNSRPLTVTVKWDPGTIKPSVVAFSGYQSTTAGGTGFVFPGQGHTVKVSGSFAGSNGGSGSSASVFTNENTIELLGACKGAGISSIPISSGTLTLG